MSGPLQSVTGGVRTTLRIESVIIFLAALLAFVALGQSWWIFAAICLAPDLSFAAYLFGPKPGAAVYNAAHSYILPLALASAAYWLDQQQVLAGAIVWIAHIGIDRALGYGLKYASSFKDTHLGPIGPKNRETA